MAFAGSGTQVDAGVVPPRYRELVRLAGGGMGEVYRAVDAELQRPVAIKLLPERYAAEHELRQRFTREALAAARLSAGPNTVTVYDVGEWQGCPYIVMEYLAGGSLEQRLREQGRPPLGRTLGWLGEAASALDHAHLNGVVHRDVKPANLLFDDADVLHVADFGVASAAGLTALTQTGTVLGTAGYLAPEQADGKRASAAADRYALAVVAFELLSGRRPYRRDSATAEAAAHLAAPIPSIFELDPELPVELDQVFARGLAKSPEARFASCAELVRAIRDSLDRAAGPTRIAAAAPGPSRSAAPRPDDGRSGRLSRGLAGVLLASLAAAGGALAFALTRDSTPRVRTVTAAAPPARTVTVTASATTRTVTAPSPGGTTSSAAALTQQAQTLIQDGNYQAALPLLQQADRLLQGSGTDAEGTADYNLAYALAQLGSCDAAVPLLEQARTLLGRQDQVDQLLAVCTGPPGHRPGRGKHQS